MEVREEITKTKKFVITKLLECVISDSTCWCNFFVAVVICVIDCGKDLVYVCFARFWA